MYKKNLFYYFMNRGTTFLMMTLMMILATKMVWKTWWM